MGQNKAQKQATERAKKTAAQPEVQSAAETKPPVEQPKPAATPIPATPAPANKQTQTIEKLREGWTAKGVNLDKLTIKDDGKFKVLIVDQGWPRVTIGPTGGIVVTDLNLTARLSMRPWTGWRYTRSSRRGSRRRQPLRFRQHSHQRRLNRSK